MKIAFFSAKPYDKQSFETVNQTYKREIDYFEERLSVRTAKLANGYGAVCVFVNDALDDETLQILASQGTRLIALRCSGFNNVDLEAADRLGLTAVRVPAYSPHSVAEHAVALMLTLNRKIHRAHARVREGNFNLEGLLGFDMNQKTAGIVGLGKIGIIVAKILSGFGCRLLASDPYPPEGWETIGLRLVSLSELFTESDIVSLHCPLMPETHHLIGEGALRQMKDGVMLINTSRGALVDANAVIRALKSGKIGYLGLDVYEEEADLFFRDLSGKVIQDDVFARLLTFPNVIVTGHQAFFTENALRKIAETTMDNIVEFEKNGICANRVTLERIAS
ncbi:MAG: 2-hydroxyacid dehydrogenase [Candidatus Omnitrophota bacterium]